MLSSLDFLLLRMCPLLLCVLIQSCKEHFFNIFLPKIFFSIFFDVLILDTAVCAHPCRTGAQAAESRDGPQSLNVRRGRSTNQTATYPGFQLSLRLFAEFWHLCPLEIDSDLLWVFGSPHVFGRSTIFCKPSHDHFSTSFGLTQNLLHKELRFKRMI